MQNAPYSDSHNEEHASISVSYSQIMARQLDLTAQNLEVLLDRTGLSIEMLMDDENLLTKGQQIQIVRN